VSVFFRSVPPPTVHIHLHIYSNLTSPDSVVPSLISKHTDKPQAGGQNGVSRTHTGIASPEEHRAFELWLRGVWTDKEKRMERFFKEGRFESGEGGENAREVVPIRQMYVFPGLEKPLIERSKWYHWIAAFGGGGVGTPLVVAGGALAGGIASIWR